MKDDYLFADTLLDRRAGTFLADNTTLAAPIASLLDPLARMRSLELALDSLGQALLVLCSNAKILYASPHAMKILQEADGLSSTGENFCASLEQDHASLSSALADLLEKQETATKVELTINRPSGKLPYKLRVNALPAARQALAIIHDTNANHMAWYDRLQARFQLTPRECECTMLLTDGYSMAEIAERMGISMQTLRQHLKHAFNKTGTHKQHELVGIVLQMHRKR
jgi:DNA-binding CsgD family transcriptional regulator